MPMKLCYFHSTYENKLRAVQSNGRPWFILFAVLIVAENIIQQCYINKKLLYRSRFAWIILLSQIVPHSAVCNYFTLFRYLQICIIKSTPVKSNLVHFTANFLHISHPESRVVSEWLVLVGGSIGADWQPRFCRSTPGQLWLQTCNLPPQNLEWMKDCPIFWSDFRDLCFRKALRFPIFWSQVPLQWRSGITERHQWSPSQKNSKIYFQFWANCL